MSEDICVIGTRIGQKMMSVETLSPLSWRLFGLLAIVAICFTICLNKLSHNKNEKRRFSDRNSGLINSVFILKKANGEEFILLNHAAAEKSTDKHATFEIDQIAELPLCNKSLVSFFGYTSVTEIPYPVMENIRTHLISNHDFYSWTRVLVSVWNQFQSIILIWKYILDYVNF